MRRIMTNTIKWAQGRGGLCPTCGQMLGLTKGEMLHYILKKVGYPEEYYKKGTGNLNYRQVSAIFQYLKRGEK
jgi:hypothetical protein